ncbi:hypothetical protein G9409_06045 [Chlorobium sp. BLA1]|uniref:hypothetical protein n=1 Tax=Candidatus Chlorobium masyuteum TaxID=2716876 RepID=UPI00141E5F14|nr:hypothetical protein [Candidatus Chlorobium masyuteum]NHQ60155.1 hypothetical protein [Candidatus Chlorobium masyuteum]
MINSDFELVKISDINKFKISGSKVLKNKKYLVQSKSFTLSRIERNLSFADFKRNREFISWKLPKTQLDLSGIMPDYSEPIENSWGNIPIEFQKIKENALNAMEKKESLYLYLKAIAEEIDPLKAFDKIELICNEISTFYGYFGTEVINSLYDENFYYTCKNHKDKVKNLKEDGLLDIFVKSKTTLKKSVIDFLCKNLPIDANTIHSMTIEFSLENFKFKSIKHELIKANEYFHIPDTLNQYGHIDVSSSNYRGIKNISGNTFEYYWLAGRIHISDKLTNKLPQYYSEEDFWIYNDCLDMMYDLKYCNE